MSLPVTLLVAILCALVFWTLLYIVVRLAVISAIHKAGANVAHANAMLSAQVDLTHRLTKHLIAQSELMLIAARHDGITDEQLAGVVKQLDERRADPEPGAQFFNNPYA